MSIISSVNLDVIISNSQLTLYKRWEAKLEDPVGIQVIQSALKNMWGYQGNSEDSYLRGYCDSAVNER